MDKMSYSELLLMGSKQVKQIKEQFTKSKNGQVQGACAIGMIAVARVGSRDQWACRAEVKRLKRELKHVMVHRPYLYQRDVCLSQFLVDLNDGEDLTPEQIAEKIEEKGF